MNDRKTLNELHQVARKIEKEQGVVIKNADQYFSDNIEEAKTDFNKACTLWRNYVGTAETPEERKERIHRFRCGGR